jgi:hypothetical protein
VLTAYLTRTSNGTGQHSYGRTMPLTTKEIRQIWNLWIGRLATQVELAVRFQVSQATISKVVRGALISRAAQNVTQHYAKRKAA